MHMGHDVEVIASLFTFDDNGRGMFYLHKQHYKNEYGINITRLDYKKPVFIYKKLKRFLGLIDVLEKAEPDIIFIHGCQFMDMNIVVNYVKEHRNVKVYVDNHADFSNSGKNILSIYILHKILWKHTARIIEPYTTKFYGVLPARLDWLINIYKLPQRKCELLVMGADDDKVSEAINNHWRRKTREKYNIRENDFLIMTGGKIDTAKAQTILLMKAVQRIKNPRLKLIIFGSVSLELESEIRDNSDGNTIQFIGWVNSEETYRYWAAADIAIFPGRHSVFWEQVVGMGLPIVCKYWKGTTHIDLGGNVVFLYKDSIEEIQNTIDQLLYGNKYFSMLEAAKGNGKERFSYKNISKRAIDE
jgi:hypothetical protein